MAEAEALAVEDRVERHRHAQFGLFHQPHLFVERLQDMFGVNNDSAFFFWFEGARLEINGLWVHAYIR